MGKQSNLTIEQRTAAALSLIRREEPAAKIARRQPGDLCYVTGAHASTSTPGEKRLPRRPRPLRGRFEAWLPAGPGWPHVLGSTLLALIAISRWS